MKTRETLVSRDWTLVSSVHEKLHLLSLADAGPVEIAITGHDENPPESRGHRLTLDARITGDHIGHGPTWARIAPDSPMFSATLVITGEPK